MKKGKRLLFVILIGWFMIFVWWFATGHAMKEAQLKRADGSYSIAVVLGAKVNGTTPSLALRYRLEAALSYAESHPNVTLVLSGGQGEDEGISEAQAMENFLSAHGFPKDRMIIEDRSTSTYENLVNTKKLIPQGVTGITLITSDYHLARAGYLAEKVGYDWDAIPAKTPKVVEAKVRFRERLALLKTWIVGK
ncbi:YdcF family protein [Sporosarcina gallistercoris]|uniref:YdcF family protein n=1 Tax=Sporosarcina gallistercoris TaxID=2762245 RepID=A0ABR8PIS1_9BACL|nr:YdcF family protein [Sporosarcina gallistercoris]MBD7908087.1 YdcF family protein [Sporosarcina gallistercoris]